MTSPSAVTSAESATEASTFVSTKARATLAPMEKLSPVATATAPAIGMRRFSFSAWSATSVASTVASSPTVADTCWVSVSKVTPPAKARLSLPPAPLAAMPSTTLSPCAERVTLGRAGSWAGSRPVTVALSMNAAVVWFSSLKAKVPPSALPLSDAEPVAKAKAPAADTSSGVLSAAASTA